MSEPSVSYTSFRDLIEEVAGIIDNGRKICNRELIEICKGCGVFDFNVDAHVYHEISETALNLLILKNTHAIYSYQRIQTKQFQLS